MKILLLVIGIASSLSSHAGIEHSERMECTGTMTPYWMSFTFFGNQPHLSASVMANDGNDSGESGLLEVEFVPGAVGEPDLFQAHQRGFKLTVFQTVLDRACQIKKLEVSLEFMNASTDQSWKLPKMWLFCASSPMPCRNPKDRK